MKQMLFTVFDSAAQAFLAPFPAATVDVAIRSTIAPRSANPVRKVKTKNNCMVVRSLRPFSVLSAVIVAERPVPSSEPLPEQRRIAQIQRAILRNIFGPIRERDEPRRRRDVALVSNPDRVLPRLIRSASETRATRDRDTISPSCMPSHGFPIDLDLRRMIARHLRA